jgi:hypothetical protein
VYNRPVQAKRGNPGSRHSPNLQMISVNEKKQQVIPAMLQPAKRYTDLRHLRDTMKFQVIDLQTNSYDKLDKTQKCSAKSIY